MSAHKKDHLYRYALIEDNNGVRRITYHRHDRFPKRVKRELDGKYGYKIKIEKVRVR